MVVMMACSTHFGIQRALSTPNGYVILSIPFRSMRYSGVSQQTWGIAFRRSIIRNSENSYWPYITRRENSFVHNWGWA